MNVPELSLVIPCHNEEKNLQPLLSAIHATLDPLAFDYEIVITDDWSRGRHIATLDADLQNDPKDLPAMLKALKGADCVCGTRAATRGKGDNWIRIASSRVANWVRNQLSGENISDAGCTYRVFKRECIAHVKFFNGAHRFLPTLIKMEGFCVIEVPVSTNPRFSGTSHYGVWNRLFKSFRDLLAVRWMKSRRIQYEIAESVTSL